MDSVEWVFVIAIVILIALSVLAVIVFFGGGEIKKLW
jgi:hypothetical protein